MGEELIHGVAIGFVEQLPKLSLGQGSHTEVGTDWPEIAWGRGLQELHLQVHPTSHLMVGGAGHLCLSLAQVGVTSDWVEVEPCDH